MAAKKKKAELIPATKSIACILLERDDPRGRGGLVATGGGGGRFVVVGRRHDNTSRPTVESHGSRYAVASRECVRTSGR